jgi:REP element-mobilizing transposase RayT
VATFAPKLWLAFFHGPVSSEFRCGWHAIDAIVVLPEHLHIMMTLPDGDADYPNRWRLIKRRFTDAVLKSSTPVERHRTGELAL